MATKLPVAASDTSFNQVAADIDTPNSGGSIIGLHYGVSVIGRVYWEVLVKSFRRAVSYRVATAAGVIVNTVFGYLRASVLVYVATVGNDSRGELDATDLATFAFLTQGLIMISGAFGDRELADRISTGDIVVDLYRPTDLQAWWYAVWLGKAGFQSIARGVPPLLLGAIAFDLRLPHSWWLWPPLLISLLLATTIGFAVRFCSNLATFWLLDNRGVDNMVTLLLSFFGGLMVPITLFPDRLETLARWLPFASTIQLPAEIYLLPADVGADRMIRVGALLGQQALWVVALLLAGRLILTSATRRVVIQGG